MSLCDKPMRELSNPGASGSVFYLSHDDKFIVKTVQKGEHQFLLRFFQGYYMVGVVFVCCLALGLRSEISLCSNVC